MDIGAIEFHSYELEEQTTIKEYLKRLLSTLWAEAENFSSKRPLGYSGWGHDAYSALIQNLLIEGTLDEDGHAEEVDYKHADKLILDYIKTL